MRVLVSTLLLLALGTLAVSAQASTTEEHRALMVAGQLMRSDGKLLRAREILRDCAAQTCDGEEAECRTIRGFCADRSREVESELPSLRVEVVDDLGTPLPLAGAELDGRAVRHGDRVELDPGRFTLRATWLGRGGSTEIDLDRGVRLERARVVIDLRMPVATRPTPWWVFALGTGAGVGAAAFTGFGVATLAQQSSLAECQPTCGWSRREAYVTSSVGTDVALGFALTAASAALVTWLVRPTVTRMERLRPESR
jgi:hypothetical protein